MSYKHTLKEIVKGNTATISHVCQGKVYFAIDVGGTRYQLELDSMDADWRAMYIQPGYRAMELMRWIRKGMQDGSLIQLTP